MYYFFSLTNIETHWYSEKILIPVWSGYRQITVIIHILKFKNNRNFDIEVIRNSNTYNLFYHLLYVSNQELIIYFWKRKSNGTIILYTMWYFSQSFRFTISFLFELLTRWIMNLFVTTIISILVIIIPTLNTL